MTKLKLSDLLSKAPKNSTVGLEGALLDELIDAFEDGRVFSSKNALSVVKKYMDTQRVDYLDPFYDFKMMGQVSERSQQTTLGKLMAKLSNKDVFSTNGIKYTLISRKINNGNKYRFIPHSEKKESLMKIKAVTDQEALEQYEEAATQQPEEGFIPEVISAAPESLFFSSFRYDFATGSVLVDEGEDVKTPIHVALNLEISEVEEVESMRDNSKVSFVDATYMEVPYLDGDGSTFQTIVLKFKKMGKPGQYIGRDGYIVDAFNNG